MEFNNKKLEKTRKLVNYIITLVFCGLLILLFGKLIDDIDQWKEEPFVRQFENKELLDKYYLEIDDVRGELKIKVEQKNNIDNAIKIAKDNYDNAKQSYENWLAARTTIGSPKEDKEIRAKVNELDEYYKTEQEWREENAIMEDKVSRLLGKEQKIRDLISQEENRAYDLKDIALRKYNLKIFLIRLLFIAPILLLGIFFIIKLRKHKYSPLFLGFSLFSFYTFFFGLVPYFPSYGGYIRYSVGVLLSLIFGIYIIHKFKKFVELKKQELKASTSERAKKVKIETAEKALNNHMCPSCGKDFIIKKWDNSERKKRDKIIHGMVTNFCRFCGLELFKKCTKCGEENYAHLPFCLNCGDDIHAHKVEGIETNN